LKATAVVEVAGAAMAVVEVAGAAMVVVEEEVEEVEWEVMAVTEVVDVVEE
jgi:hypothetical protein